jgi:hypothetical protein
LQKEFENFLLKQDELIKNSPKDRTDLLSTLKILKLIIPYNLEYKLIGSYSLNISSKLNRVVDYLIVHSFADISNIISAINDNVEAIGSISNQQLIKMQTLNVIDSLNQVK